MCGIFGWITSKPRPDDLLTLARLTDLLIHRGPDASGYQFAATADGKHHIALGQRRLPIIDIEGGIQPMRSADGKIVLIQNGEIYNYLELRDELRALGHVFHTQSDTEVLVEAWRAWGTGAFARLRGMFAVVLWDERKQMLVLARDPFGKKPLFLAETGGTILFSSEIKPLLEYPGITRQLEASAVDQYLVNRYVPGPKTFFRDVRKLRPGSFAVWQEGVLSRVTLLRGFCHTGEQSDPTLRIRRTQRGRALRACSLTMPSGFACAAMRPMEPISPAGSISSAIVANYDAPQRKSNGHSRSDSVSVHRVSWN